jgi:hypothetical protein
MWHSVFNDNAPVIGSTEIAALRADPQCRANMLRSFARMLSFYGFEQIEDSEEEQVAADGFVEDGDANPVAAAQQHEQTAVDSAVSSAADGNVTETGSQNDLASARMDSGDGHLQGIGGGSAVSESPDGEAAVPIVAGKVAAPLFDASSSSPQKQHPKRHRQNTSTPSSTSSALTSSSPPPPSPAPLPQPPSESQQAQAQPRPVFVVRPSAHFKRRARASWAASFDHNHLRITRILKSLRIFGLHAHAQAFFDALVCKMDLLGNLVFLQEL